MTLNVNTRIGLPILIENLARLAVHEEKQSNNLVVASRLETIVLLLEHLEDDKMWAVMLNEQP